MAEDPNVIRLTEIVSLLRRKSPRSFPESLTAAAMSGDVAGMQIFLKQGAGLSERSVGFASPLVAACSSNQLEAARWLIEQGAPLDPEGVQISPIQSALGKANCEAAAVLLDAGLPIEKAAWGVIAAATLGRLDMLRWLLGRGLNLDESYPGVGKLRDRALHNLKKDADPQFGQFLRGEIDLGPAPKTPPPGPKFGRTVPIATEQERPGLLNEALAIVQSVPAGAKPAGKWPALGPAAAKRELLICFAAGNGVDPLVQALLDAGGSPNHAQEGTAPPLTRAAEVAELEIMALLLKRGAEPNGPDGKSWLPLIGALMSGVPDAVRMLLDAGANPKPKLGRGPKLADYARGPYAVDLRAMLEQAPAKGGKKSVRQK